MIWLVPILILGLIYFAQLCEAVAWNNGVCKMTGRKWQIFDRDSQGGRGYKSGPHTVWISYPWVDGIWD